MFYYLGREKYSPIKGMKKGTPLRYPFKYSNTVLIYCSYSFFRFGFIGNQPFSTRSRCSKTSLMVQKEDNEKTHNRVDSRI